MIKLGAVILSIWANFSYFITALSDPGVYYPGSVDLSQYEETRFCK